MDKGSIIRTIVLAFALLNQSLVLAGKSPIPFEQEDVQNFVANSFTVVASLFAWYKHNYVSKKGKQQKEVLEKVGLK